MLKSLVPIACGLPRGINTYNNKSYTHYTWLLIRHNLSTYDNLTSFMWTHPTMAAQFRLCMNLQYQLLCSVALLADYCMLVGISEFLQE